MQIHLTEPARNWLAKTGYDPQFGARPLRRTIQRYVENPLSVRLLRGDFNPGDLIVIDELNGQLMFERHQDATTDYVRPVDVRYVDEHEPIINSRHTKRNDYPNPDVEEFINEDGEFQE
jgi:hypothetical protein